MYAGPGYAAISLSKVLVLHSEDSAISTESVAIFSD